MSHIFKTSGGALGAAVALLICATGSQAAVSEQQAARLGKDLTPMGAEKAGSKDGRIPAWTGGISSIPSSFKPGGHYPNPYADEKPLFEITAANAAEHAEHLSAGQLALLKTYPTWSMKVYPTHRDAKYPEGIYKETKQNATAVSLAGGGNGFVGTTGGVAFPIPQSGVEVIWNHLTTYRGDTFATSWAQAAVTESGKYNLVQFDYEYDYIYGNQLKPAAQRKDNQLYYFLQTVMAPPRLAGSVLLVYDYADQIKQPRKAWVYNPGSRRVRLAPSVAYDNPGTAADGLRTNDDFAMFNGATDRYDWKLIGKKEMYIPNNAYALNGNGLKVKDVLRPHHVNPEHARYELHRVWHVQANLKEGTSHVYQRRDFYLDEDSWQIHVVDKYDTRGELWRVAELHSYMFYDVPFQTPGVEVHHDLNAKRYIALSLRNEQSKVYEPIVRTPEDFTPDSLRSRGRR